MDATKHMDQVFLDRINQILISHLDEEEFGVRELCRELSVSRSKLHRKLRSLTGKSTSQFIREFRLEQAMEMLKRNEATASEIAYSVGFRSPSYFSSSFHNYFGHPPGETKLIDIETLEKGRKNNDQPNRRLASKNHRPLLLFLIITLLLLVSLSVKYTLGDPEPSAKAQNTHLNRSSGKAIAILPFEVLSDEKNDDYFSSGLMASIQNNLSQINGLTVKSQRSAERFKDSLVAPSYIARKLGIDYLITGTIAKHNDSVRIIINLLNAPEDALIISMVFEEQVNHILAVQANIGTQISKKLNVSLSPEDLTRINNIPTENIDAYNLYLKGHTAANTWEEGSQKRAIEYFNKAIELDPDFALPYAGLADSYRLLALKDRDQSDQTIQKVKSLAQKSIEISDNSMAHTVLGAMALTQECSWEVAEKEYQRAMEINPNDPVPYLYYADYLLHVKKEFESSGRYLTQARILDPFNIHHGMILTKYYFFKRDYDQAVIELDKVAQINEAFANSQELGFMIRVKQNEFDKAVAQLQKLMQTHPEYEKLTDEILLVYKTSGIQGVFKYLIDREIYFENLVSNRELTFAAYHAYLGHRDTAIDLLTKIVESRSHCIYVIPTNPYFDELHTESKFIDLMRQIGLEGILDTELSS